jgi:hypothetical protein
VTTTDVSLRLRPPIAIRVFALAWPAFVVVFLAVEFRPNDGGSWAATAAFWLFGGLLAWRLFRQGAVGTVDGRLVVRNLWWTRTVRREDIAAVTAARGARGASSGWAVTLTLRTGDVVRLDVTQVPLRGPLRRRIDRHVAAVQEWVSGRPQPFL